MSLIFHILDFIWIYSNPLFINLQAAIKAFQIKWNFEILFEIEKISAHDKILLSLKIRFFSWFSFKSQIVFAGTLSIR